MIITFRTKKELTAEHILVLASFYDPVNFNSRICEATSNVQIHVQISWLWRSFKILARARILFKTAHRFSITKGGLFLLHRNHRMIGFKYKQPRVHHRSRYSQITKYIGRRTIHSHVTIAIYHDKHKKQPHSLLRYLIVPRLRNACEKL